MSTLPLPSLLVINSTSFQHHIPDDETSELTPEAVVIFLEQVLNQTATVRNLNEIEILHP